MICMVFQPESPRYLVEFANQPEKAALALARLYRKPVSSPEVQNTLNDMQEESIKTKTMMHETGTSGFLGQFKAAFGTNKKTTYRVLVGVILMIFQQFSGTNSINYVSWPPEKSCSNSHVADPFTDVRQIDRFRSMRQQFSSR